MMLQNLTFGLETAISVQNFQLIFQKNFSKSSSDGSAGRQCDGNFYYDVLMLQNGSNIVRKEKILTPL